MKSFRIDWTTPAEIVVSQPVRPIDLEVERLFGPDPPIYNQLYRNPVTGGLYVGVLDPVEEQKEFAARALLAREWFCRCGPPDAPLLPLADYEHDRYKYSTPLKHLVSDFEKSLWANKYDVHNHPSFEDFARGVMASEYGNPFVKKSRKLRKRYPPRDLPGIELGPIWRPPAHYKRYEPRPIAEFVLGWSWLSTKKV
jgi:hypothetical protein